MLMRKKDRKSFKFIIYNSEFIIKHRKTFLAFAVIALAIFGLAQIKPVQAQGKLAANDLSRQGGANADAKGIVLGASVARSDKEAQAKIPVETYFGNPHLSLVADQLKQQNVTVYPEDIVTVFPDPQLQIGTIIRVTRATPVTIKDGNQTILYRTWSQTVQALLNEHGIELGQDDKINPSLDAQLSPDLTITITRVEITKISQQESIAYQTQTIDDPTMDRGTTKVKQAGVNGVKIKTFQVRRENGQEVSRKLIDSQVTKTAQNQIVLRGTKVVLLGQGTATWFGAPALTAASNTLPRGTQVLVTNTANGKSVQVTVIGGGIQGSAVIDLSPDAFAKLGPLGSGVIPVTLTKP